MNRRKSYNSGKNASKKPLTPKVNPLQVRESINTLIRFTEAVSVGLESICGMENQLGYYSQVIALLEEELAEMAALDPKEIPYTSADLQAVEEAIVNLHEIIVKLQAASVTPCGLLLKEIRTLLNIVHQRQNLLQSTDYLIDVLSETETFNRKYGATFAEMRLLDPGVVKGHMKKDEERFVSLLRSKCEDLKREAPELENEVATLIAYFEAAVKSKNLLLDALHVEKVGRFDQMIRRRILEDECHIAKETLKITNSDIGDGAFGIVYSAKMLIRRKCTKVILKTLNIKELLKDESVELTNEVAKWRMIDSPF